jgi:multidrug efflux pump
LPDLWYQVRKKVGDIRSSLPQGVVGPFFNDEYGDTYSLIWAFEADGFSPAEVKEIAKAVRQRLLRVPDVTKADLFGLQDEKIYIEFSHTRLAMLGVPVDQILEVVRRQNAIVATGTVETNGERVAVRVDGAPTSAEQLMSLPFTANGQTLTLGDVAEIGRGYQDPRQLAMRFNGKAVIGLGVVMAPGGNVQKLGAELDKTMAEVEAGLPVGIMVHRIANQPEVVTKSFEEFSSALLEALAIVLVVSFISARRPHRHDRGALRPAGAGNHLIDRHADAGHRLPAHLARRADHRARPSGRRRHHRGRDDDGEARTGLPAGWSAATYAYTSTAFPMLAGTLVTAVGFVPVGFARSSAGEYTNSIFWVVGLSLIISWFVAVLFTPWMGYHLLPTPKVQHHDPYNGRLYTLFRKVVVWCVTWRKTTIVITALAFVGSLAAFGLVSKQFFPTANRPELIVDLKLAQGAS